MKICTCIAPVNIAVIKYWGKRNEELILPINDSISATLSTDQLCAKTTIMASPDFQENRFWLNGKEESFESKRLRNCLEEIKKKVDPSLRDLANWKIHICSENNFPTAAGLASSAAGYACLVATLAALYNIKDDISAIARQGSGSACRSVYGGWVRWHQGIETNGTDSIAKEIVPETHWPEMRILILVVDNKQKKCASTMGMQQSVKTSELLEFRAKHIVPKRVKSMTQAILDRDFGTFAELTMKDSNQFHAVCLDTYPPCKYLNDTSHDIIEMIHRYNEVKGAIKVAYTFDAGPNACLFLLEKDVPEVLALVHEIFPPPLNSSEYLRGIPSPAESLSDDLKSALNLEKPAYGSLKYIIHTKVGKGPQILEQSEHLLTDDGTPKLI